MTTNVSTQAVTRSRFNGLNLGLWGAQVALAAVFLAAGTWKAFTPIADLAPAMPWVVNHTWLIRFIGISELAGAFGLILPAASGILPFLTPLAASGLGTIMVLATGFHLLRGEPGALPITLTLGLLAAFIAWGRFGKSKLVTIS